MLLPGRLPSEEARAMEHSFYLLDVFAEGPYSGNQLAVFRNAALLSDEDMRRLAGEVHFSETAFILSDALRDGGYDVRVFTPTEEIPFSGHAVLGAAYVLRHELVDEPVTGMRINLGGGPLEISFTYHYGSVDTVWVNQRPAEFGATLQPDTAAAVLGLSVADIDERWPVQEVSTGLPFIVVPLRSLSAVRRSRVAADEYASLLQKVSARALYVFSSESYNPDNDFNVRMFAHYYGISEDAATGAGAGCLGAFSLRYLRPDASSLDFRIEQGYEIRRPSLLFARARREKDATRVAVGGRVSMVAQGHFR